MKNIKNIFTLLVVALVGLSLTACSEDDLDTNQYQGGVSLNAFGPNPVMRGGTLRFVGSNLDQIASIQIPGVSTITSYETVKSGVPSEIRVAVPKDGPTIGVITLTTKTDQTITTKTELNYIEGIEIESMTAAAMPGDVITIEGDYLNLVHSLAFADNVVVSENGFTEHTRYVIKVAVPEEAKTGKIELYDADLTIIDPSKVEYQIIETEEAIEIGLPTISSLAGRNTAEAQGAITAKAGETITITGTYFNVVANATVGGVNVSNLSIADDGKTITFTLPAEAPSGDIVLVTKSEVEVPVGTLTTVKPTDCVAAPNPVKAGQAVTVNGNDMDLVTAIEFADAKGEYAISIAESSINTVQAFAVTVPEEAIDGQLKLVMANGERVDVAFTLVKPVVTGYNVNPVSAGAELQITGTDLDLVKSITFGDAQNEEDKFTATETLITVTVPMDGKSGAPVLNLANGTSVNGLDLNIEEAVFCYATALPGDDVELKAGTAMTLTVANGDKLTGVQMNGTDCQWVLTGENKDQLIIGIPESAGSKSTLRLISSNGEISYTIAVIPASEVTKTLWSGMTYITWGDGGRVMIPAASFESVPAGAIMTISYTQVDQTWSQAQFNYGDWSGINFDQSGDDVVTFNQTLVPTDVYGWFSDGILNRETSVILTQNILDNIQAKKGDCEDQTDCGIIIQGSDLTFTKITVSYTQSLETTIWSGSLYITWGDGGRVMLQASDFAGLKANSKMHITYDQVDQTWSQAQFNYGDWSGINFDATGEGVTTFNQTLVPTDVYGWFEDGILTRTTTVILTREILDNIQAKQGDCEDQTNCGIIIQGSDLTFKKITVE